MAAAAAKRAPPNAATIDPDRIDEYDRVTIELERLLEQRRERERLEREERERGPPERAPPG